MKCMQKWTPSLKLVVILAQCRYTKIAQRIFKYSDIRYTVLFWIKIWTVWYIGRYSMSTYKGDTNFKNSPVFGPPCRCEREIRARIARTVQKRSMGKWIIFKLDGTWRAFVDGFASACCDLDFWPFDLISVSQAQVHTWPNLVKIFTNILYSHGFSDQCLLWSWPFNFWPLNESTSMNPNTSVIKIGRNSLYCFWYGVHKVIRTHR